MAARKKKTKKKLKVVKEVPRLSPSIAFDLVEECPRQAWASHRLLGNTITLSEEKLRTRERGTALHNIVLEDGDNLDIIDAKDFRTSAAQGLRAEARISGKIPVLVPVLEDLSLAGERITQELAEQGIQLGEGTAEEKLHWTESSELGDVDCSGIPDWYSADGSQWLDLKSTTSSVKPEVCAATLLRSPGIYQDCAYTSALGQKFPEQKGRIKRLFIFAQSVEPFMVTPVYCDGQMEHIGETSWLRAIEIWARCLKAGTDRKHWPQHVKGPVAVHAPAWKLAQLLALEDLE